MRPKHRQQRRHSSLLIIAALTSALLLLGCAEEKKAAPAAPAQQAQKPVAPQPAQVAEAPKPAEPQKPAYSYNPAGRRDPFMPLIIKEEKKVETAHRPPLERYDIKEFKLTGIVWGGFGYNAMIEGPDGKGYFIRVGTVIGPNRGVVKKITQNSIVIEEKYKTYTGETQRKEIVVELKKKTGGEMP